MCTIHRLHLASVRFYGKQQRGVRWTMNLFSHRGATFSFVSLLAFVSHIYGDTTCPHSVKVEKGTDYYIICNSDEISANAFWYKGEAKEKDLIGKLENGRATVSEQRMDQYDIDLLGSLVIRNAGLAHESLYTLVTCYTNGTSEEDEVNLKITKDVTTCPDKVKIEKGTTSNVTCTTSGSTVAFYWYIGKVEEKNLIGKFEDGFLSIAKEYSDRYSIGQLGSLEIRNAGILHEYLYILLTFDSDGIQEEEWVFLSISEPCRPYVLTVATLLFLNLTVAAILPRLKQYYLN